MRRTIQTIEIYNQYSYKKYELPPIADDRYSFVLSKDKFCLKENIIIELEVMDRAWCFSESKQFRLVKNKELFFLKKIEQGDILTIKTVHDEIMILFVNHEEIGLETFEKYLIDKNYDIHFGVASNNHILLPNNGLNSKVHAKLEREDKFWIIRDLSKNGTYVNEQRISDFKKLEFGDKIQLWGTTIIFLKDIIAVRARGTKCQCGPGISQLKDTELKWITNLPVYVNENKKEIHFFHRPPRILAKYEDEMFEIEGPPAPREIQKKSMFSIIGPSLTMSIPMLLSFAIMGTGMVVPGVVTMFASAGIGAFWANKNIKDQQKQIRDEEENRNRRYKEYLQKKEEELKKIYNYNSDEICKMYPSARWLLSQTELNARLWNRNEKHEDFLNIRLGVGEMPMPAEIRIPQEKFQLFDDSLQEEPKRIKQTYDTLREIPRCIDFRQKKLVGIIGGKEKVGVYQIVRNIIAQITACNSYTDVKIVLLGDKKKYEERCLLDSVKWYPHVWDDTQQIRFLGDDTETANDVLYSLLPEFRRRKENGNGINSDIVYRPWYVVIALEPEILRNSQLGSFLYEPNNKLSLTTLLCVESYEKLPNECEEIIENTESFVGMYSVKDAEKDKVRIEFDEITYLELNEFSHRLAPIRVSENETESGIPDSITFMEMYRARNMKDLGVREKWKYNRNYENMRVPIGVKNGGNMCYLDIHEKAHGPHGLVAGTTGSGKSEVVQSYLLSLAVNFSPEDVNFFIIDFKGGGMANLFERLPHMIGQISNLSGNQIRRAMVSIMSENARRQRIFGENGVNNISEYTKLYKNSEVRIPLPHLFIVVDEFAELKREQPEFMTELISVAAIGRSLGVHLILATQKPSGTVDDKIWSNTRFRLCLRVADKQDSNDMLHKSDAAFITQAGRGYLQVGEDEIYEQFQSAWSGASISDSENVESDDIAQVYTINGRTTLVGNYQKMKNKAELKQKWIKKLVKLWEEVLEKTECTGKRYLVNEEARKNVNCTLFETFHSNQITISDSEFTRKRMLDFATLYEECGCGVLLSEENEKASKIIELAEQTSRKLPEAKGKTELDAIVEYLYELATENDLLPKTRLWLPSLSESLSLKEVQGNATTNYINGEWKEEEATEWTLDACVGVYDDPEHQYQGPISIDFANQGHYLVCGTVGTGKSTLLQTIVYSLLVKYSPRKLNIYGIDYSSGMLESFRKAPHIGGIMGEQNQEEIAKFFYMLRGILAERKNILRGGSYSNYVNVNPDTSFPAILLVIDQYPAFSERTNQIYDNAILEIAKEGANNGIFLLLSGNNIGSGEIPIKLADCLQGALCLQMNDRFQYADILKVSRVEIMPEENVKGRGLVIAHGDVLEFQAAMAIESTDDYQRSEKIRRICESMKEKYEGPNAKEIPIIPENPVYSEFIQSVEAQAALFESRCLPLGYEKRSASVWSVDQSRFFCYVISGKPRTGKRNMLQIVMQSARLKGGRVIVISQGGILQRRAAENQCEYFSMENEIQSLCEELMPILSKRNKKKHEMEINGYSDMEIYDAMSQEESIYLLIDDVVEFVNKIYNPSEGQVACSSFFETFLNKGYLHGIYIFGTVNPDMISAVYGRAVFDYFVREHTGIHFGGNVAAQQILEFDYLSYKEQNQVDKVGNGLVAAGTSMMPEGRVIIPLANK